MQYEGFTSFIFIQLWIMPVNAAFCLTGNSNGSLNDNGSISSLIRKPQRKTKDQINDIPAKNVENEKLPVEIHYPDFVQYLSYNLRGQIITSTVT